MPTTFRLFYLGNTGQFLDTVEGNVVTENQTVFDNSTWGSISDPLAQRLQTLSPDAAQGFGVDGDPTGYTSDNNIANEGFRINGGELRIHDTTQLYTGTIINYADGTSSAPVNAIVMQDTAGNLYLLPPMSGPNAYSAALTAKPILSVTLGTTDTTAGNMGADRFLLPIRDYAVAGTAGNDLINAAYVGDPQNDRIDNNDGVFANNDDLVYAGAGNDTVHAGLGNDTVYGGSGNDAVNGGNGADMVYGGAGNDYLAGFDVADLNNPAGRTLNPAVASDDGSADALFGGTGNDTLLGGAGNDTLDGGAGNDTLLGGTGDDVLFGGASGSNLMLGGDGNDAITATGSAVTELSGTLVNGDFSAGLTGWTTVNPSGATAPEVFGNDHLNLNWNDETTYGDGVQQTIATTPGSSYSLTLTAFEDNIGTANHTVRIDILNSAGEVIASEQRVILNNTSQTITLNYTADSDDTTIRITNPTSTNSINTDLKIDNISNTLVPGAHSYDDTIDGGTGNDTIIAGIGDDRVSGGTGNDTIYGGDGSDVLSGDRLNTFNPALYASQPSSVNSSFSFVNNTDHDVQLYWIDESGTSVAYGIVPAGLGFAQPTFVGHTWYAVDVATGQPVMYLGAPANGSTVTYGNGNDYIEAGAGNDTVYGDGGNDIILGGAGNDLIFGGTGDDIVYGDGGDDEIYGGAGADTLEGGDGLDLIYGGDGNDSIDGNDGNDTLYGGAGNDVLEAGAGDDRVFGGDGNDFVQGRDGNDTLYGDAGNDELLGDTGADLLDGGAGSDTLYGGADNDTLLGGYDFDRVEGGSGNDSIEGGFGNDSLYGGDGDDIIHGDYAWELDGDGDPFWFPPDVDDEGTNNDYIEGGAGNDTIYGGYGNDTIIGGAGDDALYGRDDRDLFVLQDGHGADTILGGETGDDHDVIDGATMSGNTTVIFTGDEAGTFSSGADGADFAQIEEIRTGSGDDLIDASVTTAGVVILAGAGDDSVIGGTGADAIYGGDGDDVITLGGGADTVVGGIGTDTFIVTDGFNGSFIDGGAGDFDLLDLTALSNGVDVVFTGPNAGTITDRVTGDVLTFQNISRLTLTNQDDIVDATADNGTTYIQTRGGDDVVTGSDAGGVYDDEAFGPNGAGSDTFYGGAGNDTLWLGTDDDLGYGGAGDDSVNGQEGNDTLYGGDGNDTIIGGDDNDLIEGGAGDDSLQGDYTVGGPVIADGANLTGTNGENSAIWEGAAGTSATIVMDDGSGTANDGDGVRDVLFVTGTGDGASLTVEGFDYGQDWITTAEQWTSSTVTEIAPGNHLVTLTYANGSTQSFDIFHDAGSDFDIDYAFSVHSGNDTLYGGDGNDTIHGEGSDDQLFGGAGDDELHGGTGDDLLQGGHGSDTLFGGDGNDTLLADVGGTGDDLVYGGDGDDSMRGGALDDTLHGDAGNDILFGDEGDDVLFGGQGDDALHTGPGNDTLYGGAGDDTLEAYSGNNQLFGGDDRDLINIRTVADNVTVEGGEGGLDWDTLSTTPRSDAMNVVYTGDEAGTISGTGLTVSFSEIEEVQLGSGDDAVDASAATGGVVVDTGAGDDRIIGGAGDDTITAGTGADTIDASEGDDLIALGNDGDADVIRFEDGDGNDTLTGLDAPIDNGDGTFTAVDTLDVSGLTDADGYRVNVADVVVTDTNGDGTGDAILNFPNGETITLVGIDPVTANNPAWLQALGIPAPNYIIEGTAGDDLINTGYTGDPQGDRVDGNDAADGSNDDVIDAGDGNDTVNAGLGDDTVYGDDGDDAIYGEGGHDQLSGGLGDDQIFGGEGDDTVWGNAGNDTVYGGDGDDLISPDTGDDLAYGGDGNDTIFASIGNNTYYGGAGDDVLDAGGFAWQGSMLSGDTGDDTLTSGLGSDTLYGGDDRDDFVLTNMFGSDTIEGGEAGDDWDLLDASAVTGNVTVTFSGAEAGTLTTGTNTASFSEIEEIRLGSGNDTVFGPASDGVIVDLGAGNDRFEGGSGNDLVDGGADDDTLIGGQGNDVLAGGAGTDTAVFTGPVTDYSFAFGPGGELIVTDAVGGRDGQDTITGFEYAVFDGVTYHLVTGDDGDNTTLQGPNDGTPTIIIAHEGNDWGGGHDTSDVVFGGAGDDTLDGGAGDDTLLGEDGDDLLRGEDGDDVLIGGAGQDTLQGGAGDDSLLGEDGDDVIAGGQGNDVLAGGAGTDTAVFTGPVTDYSFAFGPGGELIVTDAVGGRDGQDTITGFEYAVFDGVTYHLVTGDDGDNTTLQGPNDGTPTIIIAHEGNDWGGGHDTSDVVFGGAGDDTLDGGAGDDTLLGEDGDDLLRGEDGDDVLIGGAGQDTLQGGAGDDSLVLGNDGEADVIVFGDGDGSDTITGLDAPIDNGDGTFTGVDTLDVSGLTDADGYPVNVADVVVTDTNGDGTGDAILNFPNGETITLVGIDPAVASNPAWLQALGFPAVGAVDGTAGNDVMLPGYTDTDGDQVDGSDGHDDTIYGYGGDDSIEAGQGNDIAYGGDGADTVDGGTGDDLIHGDDGNDQLFGGAGDGSDTIYGGEGDDTITDYLGNDLIYAGAGNDLAYGGGDDDTIHGEEGNDDLRGAGGTDILYGGTGNDSLYGGMDDDLIIGGDGDDLLHGGPGDDTLIGEAGDDRFILTNGFGLADITGGETNEVSGDVLDATALTGDVYLDLTAGDPTSGESGSLTTGTDTATFAEIEEFRLGSGNDTVYAAVVDAVTIDLGAGNDSFVGGVGDDTITAGTGADTIDAGEGDDLIVLGNDGDADVIVFEDGDGNDTITGLDAPVDNGDGTFTPGDILDLLGLLDTNGYSVNVADVVVTDTNGDGTGDAILNFPGGETITLVGIDPAVAANPAWLQALGIPAVGAVDGTAGDDLMLPGDFDADGDQIDGDDGDDDTIYGYDGNDTIEAGAGDDLVYGGTGDDSVVGGAGDDTLHGDEGDDFLRGDSGDDIIFGGDGADTIRADEGDDTVHGGDGDDSIFGFTGNDLVYGGTGDDYINTRAETGVGVPDRGYPGFFAGDADAFNDRDTVYGGDGNDIILTGDDNDLVFAGVGNDSIDGGFDDDTLHGDEGDDTILGGEGRDEIFGGDGNDLIYGGLTAGDADGLMQTDDVDLRPDNNMDTLHGGDGNDTIYGLDDADQLYGDAGNDLLFGGIDNDTLYGGAGNDTLHGDQGDDRMYGDDDRDTFVLADGHGEDTIEGGEGGDDWDVIDATALTGDTILTFTGNEAGTIATGTDSATFSEIEEILLGSGDDAVDAAAATGGVVVDTGAGDDRIIGGVGDDTITAGTGADTIDAGEGDDLIVLGNDGDADVIVFEDGDGNDTITGLDAPIDNGDGTFAGVDTLNVSGLLSATGYPVRVIDVIVTDTNGDGTGDAILNFPGGETITLVGIDPAVASNPAWLQALGIPGVGPVDGTAGNDTMLPGYTDGDGDQIDGSDGLDDTIYGYDGNDSIVAGAGDDLAYGGTGTDTVLGGVGDDTLYGDAGNDSLDGGTGDDRLFGGDGVDTLLGGGGSDTIEGGDGNDLIYGGYDGTLAGPGSDGTVVYLNGQTRGLWKLENIDGEAVLTEITPDTVTRFGDIGMAPDGTLYAVRYGGTVGNQRLFTIDPDTGVATVVGNFPAQYSPEGTGLSGLNALSFDSDGVGYTSLSFENPSGTPYPALFRFDPQDLSTFEEWWINPDGGRAAGDLIFIDATTAYNLWINSAGETELIRMDLDGNGEVIGHEVIGTLPESAFGMTLDAHGNIYISGLVEPGVFGIYRIDDYTTVVGGGAGALPITLVPGTESTQRYDGLTSNAEALFGAEPDGGDLIDAAVGDDTVFAMEGNDTVYGGIGDDLLYGGTGNDLLEGGEDSDTLYGDAGNDTIYGGDGSDDIFGGNGDDLIFGDAGQDYIEGGDGNDDLDGGAGDDTLIGGAGADTMSGGAGDDLFDGINDGDEAYGGDGDDVFSVSALDLAGGTMFIDGGADGETVGDTLNIIGPAVIVYEDGNPENGTVTWLDGSVLTFQDIENVNYVPCFTADSLIKTIRGEVRAADLAPGDLVLTRDAGYQPLRWIGQRKLSQVELARNPALRPVVIKAGALGLNQPERDLTVSPQHRMLLSNHMTELMFGEEEVLVAALHLTGMPGVAQVDADAVTYVHIMFDDHQIVCGDGAWSESFQPGALTLADMDQAQREELRGLFPELFHADGRVDYPAARATLKAHEARLLRAA